MTKRISRRLQPPTAALLAILVTSLPFAASRGQENEPSIATTGNGARVSELAKFDRESILKAAFVMNFARYTNWPPPAPDGRFYVCIIGHDSVGDALQLLEGQPLKGNDVGVRPAVGRAESAACQLLYVARSEMDDVQSILTVVDGKPVLTVSDLPRFVYAGGIIGLKIFDHRVRFDINAPIAGKVGLQLSAQLLRLADFVVGKVGEGG